MDVYNLINSRIKISNNCGVIKYIGEVFGHSGLWIGVDWDSGRGKHNGTVNGHKYFETRHPTSGSMIRWSDKIEAQFETLETAILKRYLKHEENSVDESMLREVQNFLHATLFEVVGIEKLATKQNEFEKLVEVSLHSSSVYTAGDLSKLVNLKSLDLSDTLLGSWDAVGEIVGQLFALKILNLADNRLALPSPENVPTLQMKFANLRNLNLRNCYLHKWEDILSIGKMCLNLEYLCLQDNHIKAISLPENEHIFTKLKTLDLQTNGLSNFDQILNLGNIPSLEVLLLMENDIKHVKFPDCEFDEKLEIFTNLEILHLRDNPIEDEMTTFNELDKLKALHQLTFSPNVTTGGYEEMFSRAVALIGQLNILNKVEIKADNRRGAEYDVWKMLATQWLQTEQSPNERLTFNRKYRTYHSLVKKHGVPDDFGNAPSKATNSITIRLRDETTQKTVSKKVPLRMSVQTLHAVVRKLFANIEHSSDFELYYIDAKQNEIKVCMDNLSKSLGYYSLQDNDLVLINLL